MSEEQKNEGEYGLLVAFPDESHSFVHGFEAGQLWQCMHERDSVEIECTIHAENVEVIRRMCGSAGWACEFTPTELPEWINCMLRKAGKPILRLVKP